MILPEGLAVVFVALSSTTSRPGGKQRSGIGSSFMSDLVHRIESALETRFGERFHTDAAPAGREELARMAARRVCRKYEARDVAPVLVRLLCASALSAPTKSDLQQSDILIIRDKAKRHAIGALLPEMPWLIEAPVFVIVLANGRRTPQIAALRGKPFPNDHLDLFFNATVDAAIVLASFVQAAEAVGLGCCPISVIRDHAQTIAEMFALPEKVVPVAGLTLGWPAEEGALSPRLPLSVTVHEERYAETDLAAKVDAYDQRRAALRPYRRQREPERFGTAAFYGWSEDKARQYANPQRADFGAFVRRQGFRLD
ncbi:MAG TPA: nitroreductase family protein [Pseudolabrys sp.]|nr:nitroreductase family protein [Pseudolabrys sp.]